MLAMLAVWPLSVAFGEQMHGQPYREARWSVLS
jgi:hypothetical protein